MLDNRTYLYSWAHHLKKERIKVSPALRGKHQYILIYIDMSYIHRNINKYSHYGNTEMELFWLHCPVTKYGKLNGIKQTFILLAVLWIRNLEGVQCVHNPHVVCWVDESWRIYFQDSFFIHTHLEPGLGWLGQLAAGHVWFRQLSCGFHA